MASLLHTSNKESLMNVWNSRPPTWFESHVKLCVPSAGYLLPFFLIIIQQLLKNENPAIQVLLIRIWILTLRTVWQAEATVDENIWWCKPHHNAVKC
jgi:hypothetical protein